MRRLFIRNLPSPLVRFFSAAYIAGDSIQVAIDRAASLHAEHGLVSTLDILGEEVHSEDEAQEFIALYEETLAAISRDERLQGAAQPTLSFKPSGLTRIVRGSDGNLATATDLDQCLERVERICARAAELGVDVTLDMEDRAWTEFTVAACEQMHERGFSSFGTVLQTRLHRTEADLERIPPGARIRLVIGIYEEPSEVAITDKREMKERLLTYGRRLLERGVKVELATHDEEFVERFQTEVIAPGGHTPDDVEFQFLLGVPRKAVQQRLVTSGYRVRLYVPFATEWDDAVAYARRRLLENPDILGYGIKNLFRFRNR